MQGVSDCVFAQNEWFEFLSDFSVLYQYRETIPVLRIQYSRHAIIAEFPLHGEGYRNHTNNWECTELKNADFRRIPEFAVRERTPRDAVRTNK